MNDFACPRNRLCVTSYCVHLVLGTRAKLLGSMYKETSTTCSSHIPYRAQSYIRIISIALPISYTCQVYVANVNMGYTAYIFPKGHRIRVSISSAANPYYNPTSNTGANDMTTKADGLFPLNDLCIGQVLWSWICARPQSKPIIIIVRLAWMLLGPSRLADWPKLPTPSQARPLGPMPGSGPWSTWAQVLPMISNTKRSTIT